VILSSSRTASAARPAPRGVSRLLAVVIVSIGVVLALAWVGVTWIQRAIAGSESFAFVETRVRESAAVQARVGRVLGVEPALFGPYSYRGAGDRANVAVRVVVTGATCRALVDVEASAVAKTEWNLDRLVVVPEAGANAC
jgi:hypothetical protein